MYGGMSCIVPRAHALVDITYIFFKKFKCSRLQMVWSGVHYKTAPFPLLPLLIGATNSPPPPPLVSKTPTNLS